jgi:hypothetical protein
MTEADDFINPDGTGNLPETIDPGLYVVDGEGYIYYIAHTYEENGIKMYQLQSVDDRVAQGRPVSDEKLRIFFSLLEARKSEADNFLESPAVMELKLGSLLRKKTSPTSGDYVIFPGTHQGTKILINLENGTEKELTNNTLTEKYESSNTGNTYWQKIFEAKYILETSSHKIYLRGEVNKKAVQLIDDESAESRWIFHTDMQRDARFILLNSNKKPMKYVINIAQDTELRVRTAFPEAENDNDSPFNKTEAS